MMKTRRWIKAMRLLSPVLLLGLLLAGVTLVSADVNQWTWMSGANIRNQVGVYGTQGTPATGNVPGGRYGSVSWLSGSGNLWLFGGLGYDSVGDLGYLNDLWRYDPVSGQWTWMSGANVDSQAGVYGSLGTPAAGNVPGAR